MDDRYAIAAGVLLIVALVCLWAAFGFAWSG
jgi:hypothetical protein